MLPKAEGRAVGVTIYAPESKWSLNWSPALLLETWKVIWIVWFWLGLYSVPLSEADTFRFLSLLSDWIETKELFNIFEEFFETSLLIWTLLSLSSAVLVGTAFKVSKVWVFCCFFSAEFISLVATFSSSFLSTLTSVAWTADLSALFSTSVFDDSTVFVWTTGVLASVVSELLTVVALFFKIGEVATVCTSFSALSALAAWTVVSFTPK